MPATSRPRELTRWLRFDLAGSADEVGARQLPGSVGRLGWADMAPLSTTTASARIASHQQSHVQATSGPTDGEPAHGHALSSTTSAQVSPNSLFCFSLLVPWTDEVKLLELQKQRGIGVFGCEEAAIYSNPGGHVGELDTKLVDIDLHCERGGVWNTMMNTPIFVKLWATIIDDGQFRATAWTAKVDPDAVFFPDRLRWILRSPDFEGAQADNGQFLNACFIGLHGPLEVLSRKALEVYAEGYSSCDQPVEEDVYIRSCLAHLNVAQKDQFDILDEKDCARDGNVQSPDWQQCLSGHAAFHPFKTPEDYGGCVDRAPR